MEKLGWRCLERKNRNSCGHSSGREKRKNIPNTANKIHIKFDKDVSDAIDRVLASVDVGKELIIIHYYFPSVNILRLNGIEN